MPHSILLKHVQNQNNSQQLVNFINTFGLFFLKSLQKNITICEFQDMNMYIHKLIASYDVHKTLTNQYTERNPFMGCYLLEEHYYGMKLRCQFKLEGKFSCKMNNAVSPCGSSDSFGVKVHTNWGSLYQKYHYSLAFLQQVIVAVKDRNVILGVFPKFHSLNENSANLQIIFLLLITILQDF